MANKNRPVLHLVEDAENSLLKTLRTYSPPFFPNDRQSIMDSCRAFQDRLRALDIDSKEIERRRLKVLCNAYDSQTAIGIDIGLTLEAPDTDTPPSLETFTPRTHGQESLAPPEPAQESIAGQLNRLRDECRLSVEELAEKLDIRDRSVYRHLSGETIPRLKQIGAYERVFSEILATKVVIKTTSGKRQ